MLHKHFFRHSHKWKWEHWQESSLIIAHIELFTVSVRLWELDVSLSSFEMQVHFRNPKREIHREKMGKYKNYYYLKTWKGKHRSFALRGQETWGIDALALGTSSLGSAVGSGVPGPGEASKVGSGILVMRYCGADWAEEKPEGKKMLLRRGAGVAEVEGWRILCPGGLTEG